MDDSWGGGPTSKVRRLGWIRYCGDGGGETAYADADMMNRKVSPLPLGRMDGYWRSGNRLNGWSAL